MNRFIFFLLIPYFAISQDVIHQELDSILDLNQAERFLKSHPDKANEIVTFNEENHKTKMVSDLFKRGHASVESDVKNTYYKVVERYSIPHYRASYIFFDGAKMNDSIINKTRNHIIKKYNEGIPFNQLANQYSMDNNAKRGGDLGWFTQGTYHQEFENAIINSSHQINDIFTVDIDENNWYYIILMTFDTKEIREIKALKIVKTKD